MLKISEEGWVWGVVALVATFVVIAAAHQYKAGRNAAAPSYTGPMVYRASDFRRMVLFKSKQEVIAAVGQPDSTFDLAGGGQAYAYDLHPSWKFQVIDDASGTREQGAEVRFDALGQAEAVELY